MSDKSIGKFTFVLHFHIPYVIDHGVWPHGTDWLNEACAETYIPLLNIFYQLVDEGHFPKLTIGITPILSEQLSTEAFKNGFESYLETKIKNSISDQLQFGKWGNKHLKVLAKRWEDFYKKTLDSFREKYARDIIGSFRQLQDKGYLEIITSCATHGYLPLLGRDTSVQAQIKMGVTSYKRHYGRAPKGIWLPECAYRPRYNWKSPLGKSEATLRKGVEEFLSEEEIEYFIIDSHLLKGGKTVGVYIDRFESLKKLWGQFEKEYQPPDEDPQKSPYELYYVGSVNFGKPVAVFTRDPATGVQVWSGEHGYPGDEWYLDFHKKHYPGGNRYWRVTDGKVDLADKLEYEPDKIEERIRENAGHFKYLVKSTLINYHKETGLNGVLCAPYDAELFGHWWFEGPRWLYLVLKSIDEDPGIKLTTCGEYLSQNNPHKVISLPEGSWGQGGFHWIWFNDWTQWTWKHIYEAEEIMEELAKEFYESQDEKLISILKQLARELLLLESSDWQFLISTWSARDYAELRIAEHFNNFKRLADLAKKYSKGEKIDEGEWNFLRDCERKDSVFKDVDHKWFAKLQFPIKPR